MQLIEKYSTRVNRSTRGNDEFRVELPDNPRNRVQGVAIDDGQFDVILTEFTTQIEVQLRHVFGLGNTD